MYLDSKPELLEYLQQHHEVDLATYKRIAALPFVTDVDKLPENRVLWMMERHYDQLAYVPGINYLFVGGGIYTDDAGNIYAAREHNMLINFSMVDASGSAGGSADVHV